ncbi:MAG TPA: diguanylate cyclase, partial [Thermoguttaceae bacterium]|nr:diguanylate cyclase [Thermoguttaceae bacterium]
DVIAQYDNSTFALLLPETELNQAAEIAERLRQAVCRCKLPLGRSWERITVSIGAAEAAVDDDLERLLQRCEEALEQARSPGGNRVCLHTGQGVETVETAV